MNGKSSPTSPQPSPQKLPECKKEGDSEPSSLLRRPSDPQSSDVGPSGVQTPRDDQIPP